MKKLSLYSIHESIPEVIIPTPPQEPIPVETQAMTSDSLLLSHQKRIEEDDGINKWNEHILVWSTDHAFVGHIWAQSKMVCFA